MSAPTHIVNVEHVRFQVEVPDHRLLRVIGRGSYGEVWEATNVMGTPRAVKVVRRNDFVAIGMGLAVAALSRAAGL